MKKPIKNLLSSILVGFFCFALPTKLSYATTTRNITIFAEQNMTTALVKLARIYSQKNHIVATVNFNSSSELMNDVDSGEPADIFISAHSGWIDSLKQKGLVDIYNTGYIAYDRLVLATSKDNQNIPAQLLEKNISLESALKILNKQKATLLTNTEGSSSGKFSKELINFLNLDDLKVFTKLGEDKSRDLDLNNDNSQGYALILASEAKTHKNLKILAEQKQTNIIYQALVIAGDNMEVAREFLKFLKTDTARNVLRSNGFVVD